nr:vacuolar import and degradation protein 27 [Quercus suber]
MPRSIVTSQASSGVKTIFLCLKRCTYGVRSLIPTHCDHPRAPRNWPAYLLSAMSDAGQDDIAEAEPVFKSAKRRKVLRKRFSNIESEADEGSTVVAEDAPAVLARRRPQARKQGVAVSSVSRGYPTPLSSNELEDEALIPYAQHVVEQVQNERFMRPTGKATTGEDKHMVAYVDSKLAELRSSDVAAQQSGRQPNEDNRPARMLEQLHNVPNRATVGDVEEVDLRSRNLNKSKADPQTRPPTSSKRRRRFPARGEQDVARDALVDQIMRESQVSMYDRSAQTQQLKNSNHNAETSMDNDTAAAEAFKAQYYAHQEAHHRRRAPPPPAGKGAVATSSGPKLGGSRSQREKMKALEAASKGEAKKKLGAFRSGPSAIAIDLHRKRTHAAAHGLLTYCCLPRDATRSRRLPHNFQEQQSKRLSFILSCNSILPACSGEFSCQSMFAIKSLSKYLFGDSNKETIVELPQGLLFLVRPRSPKGYSELLFKDSAAFIRRTGQEFHYQLVVQRAYEEGEAELLEEEGEEDGTAVGLGDKDEKTFQLDEELHFRVDLNDHGETILAWRDLSGDEGDLYQFVCDPSTRSEAATTFELVAAQCQYETKYRKSRDQATDNDLKEFAFEDEPAIPTASPLASPSSARSPAISPSPITRSLNDLRDTEDVYSSTTMARDSSKTAATPSKAKDATSTRAPASRKVPDSGKILVKVTAELHLFDFSSGTFVLQDEGVQAIVMDVGDWKYWLQLTGDTQQWLGQEVVADINPVFNFEYLSFIFNHYTEDHSAYSWLLRFSEREPLETFQKGLQQALWEHAHETSWLKSVNDADRDYVLDAFNDLVLDDDPTRDDLREAEAAEEDEDEEYEEAEEGTEQRRAEYDEDEEEDVEEEEEKDGYVNNQLAVGAKTDRSFVVRGDRIGVFKHTDDNQLEFSTTINKMMTPKGKSLAPTKVMLHAGDRNMVLQSGTDPNSLFRMDMETGKVVDEWKVHDDIPVNIFAPESKFAQKTGEETFLGLSGNALYRIDPRLSGSKLVEKELKQYTSKNDFSAAATTEKGYIAVASNKGDIRMFDRVGINAKTALPALGDPIIGLDVSADGRWVLATTRTYLLLVDNSHKEHSKWAGKLGFEKAFAKDDKPAPRRLGLTPSHVAQFQHETKAPLSFTPAKFNMDEDKDETTIVTATGPFVVTWSMKKVLAGRKDPYHIKRYTEEIKADNFKFGSDKNIIVALPQNVDMVARRALQRPTRESIMAPPATPRRSNGRGSYLGRNEIVNSPY